MYKQRDKINIPQEGIPSFRNTIIDKQHHPAYDNFC